MIPRARETSEVVIIYPEDVQAEMNWHVDFDMVYMHIICINSGILLEHGQAGEISTTRMEEHLVLFQKKGGIWITEMCSVLFLWYFQRWLRVWQTYGLTKFCQPDLPQYLQITVAERSPHFGAIGLFLRCAMLVWCVTLRQHQKQSNGIDIDGPFTISI